MPSDSTTPCAGREANAVIRFNLSSITEVPWKNGGGITREIACWPPHSDIGTFDWRISVARIDRNGPFSSFPGVDRVITLLDGAGVTLRGERDTSHALTQPLKPYAFDGEAPIYGELVAGSCEDLNVMSRRGHIRAKVCVLHDTAHLPATRAGMLLAVGEQWHIHAADGAQYTLAPGEGIWWSGEANAWSVSAGALTTTGSGKGLIAIALHDIEALRASGERV